MRINLRMDVSGALLMAVLAVGVAPADDEPIIDATKRGDVEEVQALNQQGAAVNEAYGDGMTALHWAAEIGEQEAVRTRLDANADPAITNDAGETALDVAVRSGQKKFVAFLQTYLVEAAKAEFSFVQTIRLDPRICTTKRVLVRGYPNRATRLHFNLMI